MKVIVLLPAATVTDAGTVKPLTLELSDTVAPPVGAAPLKLTVQVDVAPGASDVAPHDKELMTGAWETVIVPPLAVTVSEAPAAVAAAAFVTPTAAVVAPLVMVTVATPTTPFEIVLEFRP